MTRVIELLYPPSMTSTRTMFVLLKPILLTRINDTFNVCPLKTDLLTRINDTFNSVEEVRVVRK
jgi:hypothetical protein